MFDVNLRADQATINKQLLAAVEIVQTNVQTTTSGGGGGGGGGAVDSVNGRIGAVTLAKADVGLGNVDNTADSAKPISTATQTALNAKADASAVISALAAKQDTLESGVNIKTVNGETLLGSGNIAVGGSNNLDGGSAASTYGGANTINGGGASG